MEGYSKNIVFVAIMFVLMVMGSERSNMMLANGQTLCRMTKEGLKACEASVSGLYPVPPSAACCSALSYADMQCLCLFKNSRLLNLYGIDPKLAFELPAKCNLPQFHCSN